MSNLGIQATGYVWHLSGAGEVKRVDLGWTPIVQIGEEWVQADANYGLAELLDEYFDSERKHCFAMGVFSNGIYDALNAPGMQTVLESAETKKQKQITIPAELPIIHLGATLRLTILWHVTKQ